MCVHVCVWERKRDTERKKIGIRGDTCYKGTYVIYLGTWVSKSTKAPKRCGHTWLDPPASRRKIVGTQQRVVIGNLDRVWTKQSVEDSLRVMRVGFHGGGWVNWVFIFPLPEEKSWKRHMDPASKMAWNDFYLPVFKLGPLPQCTKFVYMTNSLTQMWHQTTASTLGIVTVFSVSWLLHSGKTSCCVVSTLQSSNGQVLVVSNWSFWLRTSEELEFSKTYVRAV